jgi:hypothetical protein
MSESHKVNQIALCFPLVQELSSILLAEEKLEVEGIEVCIIGPESNNFSFDTNRIQCDAAPLSSLRSCV